MWLAALATITSGNPPKKNPTVVPNVTPIATLGEINMAIKIATWLAKVYEAGPITTLGATIGISTPTAISRAVAVS